MITMLALLVPTMKKIRRVIATCDELPSSVGSIEDYIVQDVPSVPASNFPGHDADVQLVAPKNVPQEALVTRPVHCTYHCRQASGTPAGFPPDGLCDFVYFQNPKELSFAEYGKSGCAKLMTTSAAKARKTLYGISIYATTAEKNEKQLTTSAGLTKFKELWDSNVTCHGINFHIADPEELAKFEGYSFLKRVWYLQRVMAGLSEKMWLVPYNLAGVYVVSTDYNKAKKNITDVLGRLTRNYKINLLVFNTHSMKYAEQIPYQPLQGQRCTVTGPTPSVPSKDPTELTLFLAKDLLKHVIIPSYVRLMISFSAAAHEFEVVYPSPTKVYGADCTSQDFVPYEVANRTQAWLNKNRAISLEKQPR
ncbi:uncharacterized protein LOC142570860 [Dermacentor variabilis]|uniref:uncharacterized protein LOC142570860 n=1 Tax=Dermacentor variabilis TaxID=34621 RepID=UPI003F5BEDA6